MQRKLSSVYTVWCWAGACTLHRDVLFNDACNYKDNTISSCRWIKYQDAAPVKWYDGDAYKYEYRFPHEVAFVCPILNKSEDAQQCVINSPVPSLKTKSMLRELLHPHRCTSTYEIQLMHSQYEQTCLYAQLPVKVFGAFVREGTQLWWKFCGHHKVFWKRWEIINIAGVFGMNCYTAFQLAW
jgi:hypothetical protein